MVGCFYGQVLHKFKCHNYGHQHLPLLGSCQYADWPESLHRLLQLWAQHLQRCRCSNDLLNWFGNWVQQAIFPHVKLSCDLLWLHLFRSPCALGLHAIRPVLRFPPAGNVGFQATHRNQFPVQQHYGELPLPTFAMEYLPCIEHVLIQTYGM